MTTLPRPATTRRPPPRTGVALAGTAGAVALAVVVGVRSGTTAAVLVGLGLCLGWVLARSRFGFTDGWRRLLTDGQGAGLRAHLVLLAVGCTLCGPLLATGTGRPALAPLGVALLVGSFVFGLGMQLGGSCASGTLYSVGSGQRAVAVTLGGFVVGSVAGVATTSWWAGLPAHAPVSFAATGLGYGGAWVGSLAALGGLAVVSVRVQRRVQRRATPTPVGRAPGVWPLWVGALGLAVLEAVVLAVSGRPWGITFAFGLWGSKILDFVGVDVRSWSYWSTPGHRAAYDAGVLGQTTSVMDLAIVLGALVASAVAGTWTLRGRVPPRLAAGSFVGGVLMGLGARLSAGCTIGAYVGGVVSFSLAGWVWGATALLGTWVGLRLRPWVRGGRAGVPDATRRW